MALWSALAHDIGEGGLEHLHAVGGPQEIGVEGGAKLRAHGRQLRHVADEDEAVAPPVVDEGEQVVEQAAGAESGVGGIEGNHGGLVHEKEGSGGGIETEVEIPHPLALGPLAVDFLVDGESGVAGVTGEHLGGPPRGGEKHHGHPELDERAHDGGHERSLPRARESLQKKETVGVPTEEKGDKTVHRPPLGGREFETKFLTHNVFKMFFYHFQNKSAKMGRNSFFRYICQHYGR